MHTRSHPSPASARRSPRHHLINTAVIVVVLGVLPVALDVATPWKVLGLIVSLVLVWRSAVLVWREAFSTRTLPDTVR